jgi:hypothetical protein
MANYAIEPIFSKIIDTSPLFVLTFFMTRRSYHVTFRMWLHGTISVHRPRATKNHKSVDERTTTIVHDGFQERIVPKIPDSLCCEIGVKRVRAKPPRGQSGRATMMRRAGRAVQAVGRGRASWLGWGGGNWVQVMDPLFYHLR